MQALGRRPAELKQRAGQPSLRPSLVSTPNAHVFYPPPPPPDFSLQELPDLPALQALAPTDPPSIHIHRTATPCHAMRAGGCIPQPRATWGSGTGRATLSSPCNHGPVSGPTVKTSE